MRRKNQTNPSTDAEFAGFHSTAHGNTLCGVRLCTAIPRLKVVVYFFNVRVFTKEYPQEAEEEILKSKDILFETQDI
jgi:hypothetical protein